MADQTMSARHRFRRTPTPMTGQLLVATPLLQDPNFEHTVVYILSHDSSGACGVVLNRATGLKTLDVIEQASEVLAKPSVIFEGGPVEPDAAICVARVRSGFTSPRFHAIDGAVGTLEIPPDDPPHIDIAELREIRVFCGYAGWKPGQLREEIAAGVWLVADSLPSDPFNVSPEYLWQNVLHRQEGITAALALYPADPSQN